MMDERNMVEIAKWMETQGYKFDFADDFWMEEYVTEHKIRDIIELLYDYGVMVYERSKK